MAEEGSTPSGAAGDGAGEALDALARAAQRGDPRARDLFARRLQEIVRGSVRGQLGPSLLRTVPVEDVVQDLLLEVERDLRKFEVRSERALRQWINRLVHRRICDLHDYHERAAKRDTRRSVSLGDLLKGVADGEEPTALTSKSPSPAQTASDRELAQRALLAIELLPVDEASAVRRIAIRGDRIADVARELEVGESTIRMRLSRGLARLYREIGGE